MKFLIDECLTIDLALIASQMGHYAVHVTRIGKGGWNDWNVAMYAGAEELILVTNNANWFRSKHKVKLFHSGLIIIKSDIIELHRKLFEIVLEVLKEESELINKIVEVDFVGDEVDLTCYDLVKSQ